MPKTSKEKLESIIKWRKENPEKVKAHRRKYNKKYYEEHKEDERVRRNTPEGKARVKKWKQDRLTIPSKRIYYILQAAQKRARNRNISFDFSLFDIVDNPPSNCACCGVAFDYSVLRRSRFNRCISFDRIDNTRGYTIDNVGIICARCNYLKSDATLIELQMLAAYMGREHARQQEKQEQH